MYMKKFTPSKSPKFHYLKNRLKYSWFTVSYLSFVLSNKRLKIKFIDVLT